MNLRVCLVAMCFAPVAYAGDVTNVQSSFDVGRECKSVAGKLPSKVSSLKKLPAFIHEKTTKTNEYNCFPAVCTLHQMSFSGFELDLVETKDSDPYILSATTFSTKARLFENIYVGQTLEELEQVTKTSIPRNRSPIYIGECGGFKIWHNGKHINKVAADCDCT